MFIKKFTDPTKHVFFLHKKIIVETFHSSVKKSMNDVLNHHRFVIAFTKRKQTSVGVSLYSKIFLTNNTEVV